MQSLKVSKLACGLVRDFSISVSSSTSSLSGAILEEQRLSNEGRLMVISSGPWHWRRRWRWRCDGDADAEEVKGDYVSSSDATLLFTVNLFDADVCVDDEGMWACEMMATKGGHNGCDWVSKAARAGRRHASISN